jgi:catechol 2,3-dioxygenase-like lactoylglutathione lyase family enzyme
MAISRLDHVNIRTRRLADSVAFYGGVLGMTMTPPPSATDLSKGAYACDASGLPIVHLVGADIEVPGNDPVRGAAQRGMIDHFALRGDDPAGLADRLTRHGSAFNRMDVPMIGMHLIFVRDPNGVMVEIGFPLSP